MKLSFGHRKFRKHATNIDSLDNGALKFDQFFNQTEHKLFNQLLHNFNENEQMSQIMTSLLGQIQGKMIVFFL